MVLARQNLPVSGLFQNVLGIGVLKEAPHLGAKGDIGLGFGQMHGRALPWGRLLLRLSWGTPGPPVKGPPPP